MDKEVRYTQEELGVPVNRNNLIKIIANAPKATIIHVKNYESKNGHGEVANYFYNKGVDYGSMKDKSCEELSFMENDETMKIQVTWNMWVDAQGQKYTRKAKDRWLKKFSETYAFGHPLLMEAFAKVRQSLMAPRPSTVDYDKLGNGIYEHEGVLHIRDCALIHKEIVRNGDYPVTATEPVNALADAIRRKLSIGKYRQVRLDGRFDYISVCGQLVMQNEGGTEAFVGLSEYKNAVHPRIEDLVV